MQQPGGTHTKKCNRLFVISQITSSLHSLNNHGYKGRKSQPILRGQTSKDTTSKKHVQFNSAGIRRYEPDDDFRH